jgi:hypothetical protein
MMANWDGIADFASGVLRSALIIAGFVVGGLALAVMLGCDEFAATARPTVNVAALDSEWCIDHMAQDFPSRECCRAYEGGGCGCAISQCPGDVAYEYGLKTCRESFDHGLKAGRESCEAAR